MPQLLNKATGLKKRQAIDHAGRTMLLWVVVASVAVSFLLVGAQFLYNQFAYNNRVLGAKNEAAATLEQNLKNIEELKAAFGPLDAGTNPNVSSTKVLSALPSELDTSAFGTSLQKVIAPRSGVTMDSVEISEASSASSFEEGVSAGGEATDKSLPQEIKIDLSVVGSYEQLSSFIRDLELTIRPIKINIMNITGSDTNTRASIEMTTYYQPSKTVTIVKKELPR